MPAKPSATQPSEDTASHASVRKLYSPKQTACATWVGGPLAAMYCIRANYLALSRPVQARHTLYWGAVAFVVYFAMAMLLPEGFPFLLINAVLGIGGLESVRRFQLSKEAIEQSPEYGFHSNREVVGVALFANAAALIAVLPIVIGAGVFESVIGT